MNFFFFSGTFLVRFSQSTKCAFSIAAVVSSKKNTNDNNNNTSVQQILIESSHKGYQTPDGSYHATLTNVIQSYSDILLYPAPNTLSKCKFFHGFLTYKETVSLLKSQQKGTYLMRFSKSQPGSLVIAYTSNGNSVKQTIVNSSTLGYTINDRSWNTLDMLIYDNRNRLITPCYAIAYEAPIVETKTSNTKTGNTKTRAAATTSTTSTTATTATTATISTTTSSTQSMTERTRTTDNRTRLRPPSLQRASSAPISGRDSDNYDEAYNYGMLPISPTDARGTTRKEIPLLPDDINERKESNDIPTNGSVNGSSTINSGESSEHKVGEVLNGGIVTTADMNNFIVPGHYDVVTTETLPPNPTSPVQLLRSMSAPDRDRSLSNSSPSENAARLAAGLPLNTEDTMLKETKSDSKQGSHHPD